MNDHDQWYTTFFDALAFDVWATLVPDGHSDTEAAYILRQLGLKPGDRILDGPSGDGRLAVRFARLGLTVAAFDLSRVAVDRLRDTAAADGLDIQVSRADLGDPDRWPNGDVDGVACVGNSFGYVDDATTSRYLTGVAARLRPGARLVIDYPVVAEAFLPQYSEGVSQHHDGDAELTIDSRYDLASSTSIDSMVLRHGDRCESRVASHRVRTYRQVVDLLDSAGFEPEHAHGSVAGEPFRVGSPGLWLTARRR